MAKNILVLRESNVRCISTIAHPFGVIESYKGRHILRDFSKTIPLNLLNKEIKSVEEGKPVEEFHISYSGKSYATKDALKRCLKKSTGYEYTITDYIPIWKGFRIKIYGYRVEAVRTDYLKAYTMSEKDKKRLENKEARRLNKNLNQMFVVEPLAAALQSIDNRLHIDESYRSIIVNADVLKHLAPCNVNSATYDKKVAEANEEFFKLYNNTLKNEIIKAANALGLYTIEELSLKGYSPECYTKPLLKIKKVKMNIAKQ